MKAAAAVAATTIAIALTVAVRAGDHRGRAAHYEIDILDRLGGGLEAIANFECDRLEVVPQQVEVRRGQGA